MLELCDELTLSNEQQTGTDIVITRAPVNKVKIPFCVLKFSTNKNFKVSEKINLSIQVFTEF